MQILKDQIDDRHQSHHLIDRCIKQAGKLATLINDLLDISRLLDGKVLLQMVHFDLVELTKEILSNYPDLVKHQLKLETDNPVMVCADRLRVEQVLTNLITNAIKYSPEGGIVEVAIIDDAEAITILVRDEGIGIDIEHLEEVFTQFYRIIDSRFPTPGYGLGLFISKEIVDRHGGTIEVASQKGVGSTFKVRLPKNRNNFCS